VYAVSFGLLWGFLGNVLIWHAPIATSLARGALGGIFFATAAVAREGGGRRRRRRARR